MMRSVEVAFLSRNEVVSLGLEPRDVMAAIEAALLEHADGTYEMPPKIGIHPEITGTDNFIHAMPAYLKTMGACGLKWVAGFDNNFKVDLPTVTGVQIYNDVETGLPLAIMDCSYLTGLRTAAVSTVAARSCARPNPEVLALAGCGFQGTMHLWFLTAAIPTLKQVRLLDVRQEAVAALKAKASEYFGGEIVECRSNEELVRGADIISTCTFGDKPTVDNECFGEGAFGVGIEGGCGFTAEALHGADKFLVDDVPLAKYFEELGKDWVTPEGEPAPMFPGGLPDVYATIGEVLAGKKPARDSDRERIVATPIGMGICDIALTKVICERAAAKGVGQKVALM
jgi:ornithine cyclodeaminase/alanine dehydrogenase